MRCYSEPTRAVCIREVQNSIKDSVKQLLEDKINKFGLAEFFKITDQEIRGKNGSLIIFKGMQNYNAQSIKSLEDINVAWVEEAQTLSALSLRMLRPTIRAENSELWFSWNPMSKHDAVDKLLRGPNCPKDSIVVQVSWKDNPWFPAVLKQEMEEDYQNDPDEADHVWGGNYEIVTKGAYYAKLLLEAERAGRITNVPYDPEYPVYTAWDLGIDDCTAIWFVQVVGLEVRVIDFYQTRNIGLLDIARDAVKSKPYTYEEHYLPHDVDTRELSTAKTRKEQLEQIGLRPIRAGSKLPVADGINAARNLIPKCVFDATKCEEGIDALKSYRTEEDEDKNTNKAKPRHDWASHPADAYRELAVNLFDVKLRSRRPSVAYVDYDPLNYSPDPDGHRLERQHQADIDYDPFSYS